MGQTGAHQSVRAESIPHVGRCQARCGTFEVYLGRLIAAEAGLLEEVTGTELAVHPAITMGKPDTLMAATANGLRRIARRLFWPRPALYLPIGILRHGRKGNILQPGFELYISGFPRSGNTFALKAFLSANPDTPVRSHRHIPTFVIHSIKHDMRGMVLIRNPLDAATSWAIFTRTPLKEALQYYQDYYSVLLPYHKRLFFVSFEEVIQDFGQVTREFNARWGTRYVPFENTDENVASCMSEIDLEYRDEDGAVAEWQVARASPARKPEKEALLGELNRSASLQKELRAAQELYQFLAPRPLFLPSRPRHGTRTTQSI